MVDIPYELWLHITSFLVDDETWTLRTVNTSLRDIAMDKRFRRIAVSLHDIFSKQYHRRFLRFSDNDIAMRVRELEICTYALTDFPDPKQISLPKKTFLNIGNYLRSCIKSDKNSVISTFQSFTKIRHVKIDFEFLRGRALQESIPFFHACLLSSSNHLRSLELSFPVELMETIIPLGLFLPHLKSFSVTLFTLPNTGEAERLFSGTATTTLIPFINRHRSTLTALDLRLFPLPPTWSMFLPVMATNFNLSPLFTSLDHIPNLRTLSISISASTAVDCIFRLLKIHSKTLVQLAVYMTDPKIKSTHGILDQFEIPFPQLEEFAIRYHYDTQSLASSAYQKPTLGFVRQHKSSLVSLKLLNSVHDMAHFLAFLDPLVSFHKLRYLKMSLQVLTPEMLDILSSRLLNLHKLDVLVAYLKCHHTSPLMVNEEEEYEFCTEIKHHSYQHWGLKHLILTFENEGPKPTITYGAAAIAEVMPFLQTFNGITWTQFAREAKRIAAPHFRYQPVHWIL